MSDHVLIGEIVQADFEPEDYPGATMLTILVSPQARIGHWYLRMERIEKPDVGGGVPWQQP